MTGFCIDTITIDERLRPDRGVLRVAALAVTADARQAAQRILDDARAQAENIRRQAEREAQRRTQGAEEETLRRADELIKALEHANATFLDHAQDIIVGLAKGVFDRLVMETTPQERIDIVLKRLLLEAPPKLVNPVLRIHPGDSGLLPAVDWEVKPDASLAPGTCLLEAHSGQWRVDFGAAVSALTQVFAVAAAEGMDVGSKAPEAARDDNDHDEVREDY